MNERQIDVAPQDDGNYEVSVVYADGETTVSLVLDEVEHLANGRLGNDEATAHATITYLLSLQDVRELPARVLISDVLAAYPDAIKSIAILRDQAQTRP